MFEFVNGVWEITHGSVNPAVQGNHTIEYCIQISTRGSDGIELNKGSKRRARLG